LRASNRKSFFIPEYRSDFLNNRLYFRPNCYFTLRKRRQNPVRYFWESPTYLKTNKKPACGFRTPYAKKSSTQREKKTSGLRETAVPIAQP
jgi:hypothetical protein